MNIVPTQKSNVSRATISFEKIHDERRAHEREISPSRRRPMRGAEAEPLFKKAITGCNIDTLLVIAARNSMKNQQKPKNGPPGISANTFGKAIEALSPKVPCCVAAIPRKMNAAGNVINAAETDFEEFIHALAVSPLNATSSFSSSSWSS
jgi:hypothetical protein